MTESTRYAPHLGYGDYLRFSRLIQERFGLHFPETRRADLERGIRHAFAATTCRDLNDYYQMLLNDDQTIHLQRLVNTLTIGESHFFRNAGHFNALQKYILPEIIQRRRHLRTLRIWSAGCSSGEEPYSIAMLLRELLPDVDDWAITILGTDVNTEALDRARRGRYSEWAFREVRARALRERYFRPEGKYFHLSPDVRRMVNFTPLNLVEDDYPSFRSNTMFMDLILCRNVTIYFSTSTTRQVVERFYDALVDGGWLIVGHSEHSFTTYSRFQACSYPNTIIYQRTGVPTVLPEDWEWLPPTPEVTGAPSLRVPPPPAVVETPAAPADRAGEEPDASPLERARQLLDYGHSEKARDLLLGIAEHNPNAGERCTLLCQAYANLGHLDDAEQWCRRAIAADSLAREAYYTLSLVLQHRDDLTAATEAMQKVIYLNHRSVRGHYGIAGLYHTQGMLRQALKSLDNVLRLLAGRDPSELVPETGGITVKRLHDAVIRQQQQWQAEAYERTQGDRR